MPDPIVNPDPGFKQDLFAEAVRRAQQMSEQGSQAAQAQTPQPPPPQGAQAEPPQVPAAPQQFPAEALDEFDLGIDPDLKEQLKQQAKGGMNVLEMASLSALSAVNPQMAQFLMQQRQASTGQARQILAQLQQQSQIYKRESARQESIRERERVRQDQALRRTLAQRNATRVMAMEEALQEHGVTDAPTPPADLSDTDAVNDWIRQARQAAGPAVRKSEARRAFLETMPQVRLMAKQGALPAGQEEQAFKEILAQATDLTPEQIDNTLSNYTASLAAISAQNAQVQQAKLEGTRSQIREAESLIDYRSEQVAALQDAVGRRDAVEARRYFTALLGFQEDLLSARARIASEIALKESFLIDIAPEAGERARATLSDLNTAILENQRDVERFRREVEAALGEFDPVTHFRQSMAHAIQTVLIPTVGEEIPSNSIEGALAWIQENKNNPFWRPLIQEQFYPAARNRLMMGRSDQEIEQIRKLLRSKQMDLGLFNIQE